MDDSSPENNLVFPMWTAALGERNLESDGE